MLSKKSIKILSIVLMVVILLMTLGSSVFATISGTFDPDEKALEGTGAGDLANTILGAIKWIGVAISIGMLMYLGIKYVTSSPDGKADLKGKLGVYILGFVLIVAATVIVGIIENAIPTTSGTGEEKETKGSSIVTTAEL